MSLNILNIERQVRGAIKSYLADFFLLRGDTPSKEKNPVLGGQGGTPHFRWGHFGKMILHLGGWGLTASLREAVKTT